MNSVYPIHTNADHQALSSRPLTEFDLQKQQSPLLSHLVKFIDQPIDTSKRHKTPFYSNLSIELIKSISTGFCDVYQIRDPNEKFHKKTRYQILKSPEKVAAIKQNFRNAMVITIHLILLKRIFLLTFENGNQIDILSKQAVELYEGEIDYLGRIPKLQKEAEGLLKQEEALLGCLQRTLASHEGDFQEKEVLQDIIQCKMRICILFNKIDIHFPNLLQIIPIYLQKNKETYDSLIERIC